MRKYTINEQRLITDIMDLNSDCSPTELSFGYVGEDNHVHEGIVIKKACGKIVSYIVSSALVLTTSIDEHGLHVTCESDMVVRRGVDEKL